MFIYTCSFINVLASQYTIWIYDRSRQSVLDHGFALRPVTTHEMRLEVSGQEKLDKGLSTCTDQFIPIMKPYHAPMCHVSVPVCGGESRFKISPSTQYKGLEGQHVDGSI